MVEGSTPKYMAQFIYDQKFQTFAHIVPEKA